MQVSVNKTVLQKVKNAQLTARKAKDKFATGVLTALYSECSIIGKNDGNRNTTDEECIKVITKFKKGVNENIKLKRDSGCNARDLAPFYIELEIYDEFLPTQMTEDELRINIKDIIDVNGFTTMKDMGKIMGKLRENYAGLYDGKMASGIIKILLNY